MYYSEQFNRKFIFLHLPFLWISPTLSALSTFSLSLSHFHSVSFMVSRAKDLWSQTIMKMFEETPHQTLQASIIPSPWSWTRRIFFSGSNRFFHVFEVANSFVFFKVQQWYHQSFSLLKMKNLALWIRNFLIGSSRISSYFHGFFRPSLTICLHELLVVTPRVSILSETVQWFLSYIYI